VSGRAIASGRGLWTDGMKLVWQLLRRLPRGQTPRSRGPEKSIIYSPSPSPLHLVVNQKRKEANDQSRITFPPLPVSVRTTVSSDYPFSRLS
jgi:hypothetical protein